MDQAGAVECREDDQVDPQVVEVVTPMGDTRVAKFLLLELLARILGLLLWVLCAWRPHLDIRVERGWEYARG